MKQEIIKIELKKDRKCIISILNNKLFEIEIKPEDFDKEKKYLFESEIPAQAQMLMKMFMNK